MTSTLNSTTGTLGQNSIFVGIWENVKPYTTVHTLLQLSAVNRDDFVNARLYLEWANDLEQPTVGMITSSLEVFCQNAVTILEVPHRGSWYRARIVARDRPLNLTFESIHRHNPTGVTLSDNSGNNTGVINRSLATVLTDGQGNIIKHTGSLDTELPSLCVALRDADGDPILTQNGTLALKPTTDMLSNVAALDTDGGKLYQNNMLVSKTAGSNSIDPIASASFRANPAYTVPYMALETNSQLYQENQTNASGNVALYVHLVNNRGNDVDSSAPLFVTSVGNINRYNVFDSTNLAPNGLKTTPVIVSQATTNLRFLTCYNGGVVNGWVRVLDGSDNIRLNICVPPSDYHDIALVHGCMLSGGMKLKVSAAQDYSTDISVGDNAIYASAVYSLTNAGAAL